MNLKEGVVKISFSCDAFSFFLIDREPTFPLHFHLLINAVTWLKYCRYDVKHYPINQSSILIMNVCVCVCVNNRGGGIVDNLPQN